MAPIITHPSLATAVLLVASAASVDAFVPAQTSPAPVTFRSVLHQSSVEPAPARARSPLVRLHAEADADAESGGDANAEEDTKAETPDADAVEEEEEEEEDPEVIELKTKIAEMESAVKAKRADSFRVQEAAETYSEAGYLRKVAEMDQIRKMRGVAFKSNEFTARASATQPFLPILDELKILDDKYADNDFAKSYKALRWDLNNALTALGMTEFTAEVGAKADPTRFDAVEERFSEDYGKGTVVEPVGIGMEIEGNVMRMAQCVVSLGSEAEAKKAEEDEAAAVAAAAAAAESEAGGEEKAPEEGE